MAISSRHAKKTGQRMQVEEGSELTHCVGESGQSGAENLLSPQGMAAIVNRKSMCKGPETGRRKGGRR